MFIYFLPVTSVLALSNKSEIILLAIDLSIELSNQPAEHFVSRRPLVSIPFQVHLKTDTYQNRILRYANTTWEKVNTHIYIYLNVYASIKTSCPDSHIYISYMLHSLEHPIHADYQLEF